MSYTPPPVEVIRAAQAATDRAGYDALPGLNQSKARVLLQSPMKYRYLLDNPENSTKALREGTMAHAAVLEPDVFKRYKPAPDVPRTSNANKELHKQFLESLGPDDIACDSDEHAKALSYAAGFKETMARHGIRIHASEIMLQAEYMGVKLKGSIDFISEDGFINDLKTSKELATMAGFGREVQRNPDFRLQAAWYLMLWNLVFAERAAGYRLICVEKTAPHEGAVFELDQELIADGGLAMLEAINTYAKCSEFDSWPTYPAEIIKVEPWRKPGESVIRF